MQPPAAFTVSKPLLVYLAGFYADFDYWRSGSYKKWICFNRRVREVSAVAYGIVASAIIHPPYTGHLQGATTVRYNEKWLV